MTNTSPGLSSTVLPSTSTSCSSTCIFQASCSMVIKISLSSAPLHCLLREPFGSPQLSCSVSPSATPTTMVRLSKPKTFQAYLDNCHRRYSCVHCRAHLANHDDLISKSFQGSQGRAYLFNSVVNVGCGPAEERVLLTGLHAVADIYCENCKTTLGWKYEQAFETSQKYKEGKFIIELNHMIKDNGWD
ncbi:protein yippee-like 3 isoform X1 [Erythrolamprus reginae]|uniref:protein yippee-like 3 isoform X1 n=1 Tax=Erythrolamprus reginae TaxID=121349 RepID=UPI00396C3472